MIDDDNIEWSDAANPDAPPRKARVLDLIDPREPRVDSDTRRERLDICKSCENLNAVRQCKLCLCFMPAKTWLERAHCDIGKW